MGLKCGIIGLPNVGKSTFFGALCRRKVPSENFPFCTIEPNVGVLPIPDKRLNQLAACVHPSHVEPAAISLVDIAGLVKGASQGEGLGNQFLAHIREVAVLVHVVRCFEDSDIVHVAGNIDPLFDQAVIYQELHQADLSFLTKKREKLARLVKSGHKDAVEQAALLDRFLTAMQAGTPTTAIPTNDDEKHWVKQWQLLTYKPVIYVANVDEATLEGRENPHLDRFKAAMAAQNVAVIPICIALEAAIAELPPEEQQDFLAAYQLEENSVSQLIRAIFNLLGLITYFTAGPQEVRAWAIPKGTLAPQAASVIHSDFEKAFIKAEVIKLPDYLHYRTRDACRQAGKIAVEGKHYVVQDGDILLFRCKT